MRLPILLTAIASIPALLASPFHLRSPNSKDITTRDYKYIRSNSTKSYCPSRPAREDYQREIFDGFINALYIEKDVIGVSPSLFPSLNSERMPPQRETQNLCSNP